MLVKRLSDKRFDYCLPADVQFLCRVVQFVQHWRGEVYIDPLDRFIMWPELVKKRETSLPLSARRAMASADMLF